MCKIALKLHMNLCKDIYRQPSCFLQGETCNQINESLTAYRYSILCLSFHASTLLSGIHIDNDKML